MAQNHSFCIINFDSQVTVHEAVQRASFPGVYVSDYTIGTLCLRIYEMHVECFHWLPLVSKKLGRHESAETHGLPLLNNRFPPRT